MPRGMLDTGATTGFPIWDTQADISRATAATIIVFASFIEAPSRLYTHPQCAVVSWVTLPLEPPPGHCVPSDGSADRRATQCATTARYGLRALVARYDREAGSTTGRRCEPYSRAC